MFFYDRSKGGFASQFKFKMYADDKKKRYLSHNHNKIVKIHFSMSVNG